MSYSIEPHDNHSTMSLKKKNLYVFIKYLNLLKTYYYINEFITNFKITTLMHEKYSLKKEYYNLIRNQKKIEDRINKKNYEISNICSNSNNGHSWIIERDRGLYGEKYSYCSICGKHKCSNNFFNI